MFCNFVLALGQLMGVVQTEGLEDVTTDMVRFAEADLQILANPIFAPTCA